MNFHEAINLKTICHTSDRISLQYIHEERSPVLGHSVQQVFLLLNNHQHSFYSKGWLKSASRLANSTHRDRRFYIDKALFSTRAFLSPPEFDIISTMSVPAPTMLAALYTYKAQGCWVILLHLSRQEFVKNTKKWNSTCRSWYVPRKWERCHCRYGRKRDTPQKCGEKIITHINYRFNFCGDDLSGQFCCGLFTLHCGLVGTGGISEFTRQFFNTIVIYQTGYCQFKIHKITPA